MFHSGLASTWCLPGRLPVSSEARAGVQIAVGVKQCVKAKPDSPIASMTGVRAWGLPRQPIVSVRCWSVMMTRTLRTLSGMSLGVWVISDSFSQWRAMNYRTLAHTSLYAHGFAPTETDKMTKSELHYQLCLS